ncbi:MAG: hypothetical protein HKN44_04235 [Ilumatobacter sp.]|nr:hypothetical protein [Ilumatobacter sp.]
MKRLESLWAMLAIGRRSEKVVAVAIGVMLVVVAAVITVAPRALTRAEESSLEQAVEDAPAVLKRMSVRAIEDFGTGAGDDPLSAPRDVVARAAEAIPETVASSFGPARVILDSNRFNVRTVNGTAPASPTLLTMRIDPGLADHSRVVEGRAAAAVSESVGRRQVIDLELSTVAADVMGWSLGDELEVVADTTDTVTRRFVGGLPDPFIVRLVGLRELDDVSDLHWFGDSRLHRPTVSDTGLGATFSVHGSIDVDAYSARPFTVNGRSPFLVEQRRDLLPSTVTVDTTDELVAGLVALEAATVSRPSPGRPGVAVGLRRVLSAEADQRAVARSTLVVAAVGVVAVALAVLAQSLQVAFSRRRSWLNVARARGASPSQVVTTTMLEVGIVAAVAVVVGTIAARLAIGGTSSTVEARLLVGLWLGAVTVAGLLAVAEVRRSTATASRVGTRARLGKWGRVSGTVLVVVAIGSLITFRRRGLAVEAGDIDALVVLLPVLVPLAVVFLTRWIVPLVLGLVARLGMNLGPGRLVGVRRAISDPGAGAGLIAVLALALTVAGLGLGVNRSLEAGIADASWAEVGAPYRIDSRDPEISEAVADIDDIEVAEYGDNQFRLQQGGDVTTARLINIETTAVEELTSGTAADLRLPDALLLADDEGRIPVVASRRIGGQPIRRGDVVRGTGSVGEVEFVAVQVRDEAFGHDRDWIIADRAVFEGVTAREAPTSSLLFELPDERRADLDALVESEGLVVEDRSSVADRQRRDPLVRAVRRGYLAAGAVASALGLMGVAGLAIVTARQRRREVAVLGLLGASRVEIARAVRSELIGPVAAGIVFGTVLGALMTAAFDGRFDLSPFTDGAVVDFRADVAGQLVAAGAVVVGALVLMVALVRRIVHVRVDDIMRVDGAA